MIVDDPVGRCITGFERREIYVSRLVPLRKTYVRVQKPGTHVTEILLTVTFICDNNKLTHYR